MIDASAPLSASTELRRSVNRERTSTKLSDRGVENHLELALSRFASRSKVHQRNNEPLMAHSGHTDKYVLHSIELRYGEDGQKNGRVLLNVKRCT